MKEIIIKYEGNCKRCNAFLEIGEPAMYEKSQGIFCMGCEPKDIEEIRHFRQITANKKIERLENKAERLEKDAEKRLKQMEPFRGDIAFNTQPGHIPFRARLLKSQDKAYSELTEAKEIREKAESLKNVRVAGDAERKREEERKELDKTLTIGSKVYDFAYREGIIKKINKKTYTIVFTSGFTCARDKVFVKPV